MKARNMILSGVAILVILIAINTVWAIEIGVPPVDDAPQVYLLKKTFDICDQDGGHLSHSTPLPGGSVPPSGIEGEGESQSGCVDFIGDRFNEYLFTGEQIAILVAVRDLNGAEDILKADLYVNDIERVKCNLLDVNDVRANGWYGHDVNADLDQQPPQKSGGTHTGFDPAFDKLYQCVFTATPSDSGMSIVVVKSYDQNDNEGVSVPDNVFFNPAITLDIFTEPSETVTFPAGTPAQTVYSLDTLKIKNTAEGGVDLFAWISATDLFAADGAAKCPESNIIDVEDWMEYRCKIGTIFNNPWHYLQNPNDKEDCTIESCQDATPLMPDHMPLSIILNQHMAECWFRFTYPTPICVGDFTEGGEIIIYARAI